ncbi:MAG: 30S ribosomal protein S5 [Parcubacteria group bacterium]
MDRRESRGRRPKSEFDHKMVDLSRVARVVAGGKRFKFRATVVLGNRRGRVGFGMGKGRDVSSAVDKAARLARKNLVEVPIINDTIPHEVRVHFGGADILIKPARPGTGIIAGGAVRPVIELAGIRNVVSKMFGSSNAANNVKATIEALSQLRTPEVLSATRGVTVKGTFQSISKPALKKKGTS